MDMVRCGLRHPILALLLCNGWSLLFALDVLAQPADVPLSARDLEIRQRYEASLARDPYQSQAFNRTYQTYLDAEGVEQWIEALTENDDDRASLILAGRIHARRLETAEAIACIEQARELGADGTQIDWLLGKIYADAGRYEDATPLLRNAANALSDDEMRAAAIRLLGDTYNRLGDRDAAIAAWKLLAESSSDDAFARWDLAGIYEDYALWSQAAAAYDDIAERSQSDPYARCRALRAKAAALLQLNEVDDAIVTLEAALGLASPGNWLFDEIKQQLIAVYDGRGDLAGLANYVRAQVDAAPASIEYRALLADVYTRLNEVDAAEAEYRALLERAPNNLTAYTSLVGLYVDADRTEDAADTMRTLIVRYPRDTDFVRQLGELYWNAGDEARAILAWRSVLDSDSRPRQHAELADWLSAHDLFEDAIDELKIALASKQDRTWLFRVAELHAELGDDTQALAAWDATLSADSTAPEITEVARLLETYNFIDEAESLYARAVDADPEQSESRHALAALLARAERYEESIPHFERLANAADSEYWQFRGERGLLRAFKALGLMAAKQEEWEQAVAREPDSVSHKLRLARLYESRGNLFGAADLYSACAELESGEASHREALAKAYFRSARYTQAAETYRALLEDQPSRARGYLRELLSVYRRLNNHADATAAAERVVELAPSDAQARVQLAQVYLTQRRADDAFLQFRHAIRLEPDQSSLHLLYGEALTDQRRFPDARDAFHRLLEQSEDRGVRLDCLRRLATIHVELNSLDELTRAYERRIRATPNRLDAYAELAAIYTGAERPAEALQALERAHHRVGDREAMLHMLLNAAFNADDLESTITYTEELLARSGKPDVFALVRLGHAYADLGDLDTALTTWARIREVYPDDPKAMTSEAEALFKHGFFEEALERERAALKIDPFDSGLRAKFANHLAGQGDHDAALEQYFLALDYGEPPGQAAVPIPNNLKRGRANFRTQIVKAIVALAGPFDFLDAVVERFERAWDENPESQTARDDLIVAYESLHRVGDVINLAEESLLKQPNDTALIQKLADLLAQANRYEDAADRYLQLAALEPNRQRYFKLRVVALYTVGEDHDSALALLKSMHEAMPSDFQVAVQLATAYGKRDEPEKADALFAELRSPESHYWQADAAPKSNVRNPQQVTRERQSVNYAWATFLEQTDRMEEARRAYETMLIEPDDPAFRSGARSNVYHVSAQGRMGNIDNFQNTVQRAFPSVSHHRVRAVTKLMELGIEVETVLDRARERSGETEATILTLEKLRIALRMFDDRDTAAEPINALIQENPQDVELYNALLLLQEQQLDFDAVLATYERMKGVFPQEAGRIEQSEMSIALQEGDFDRVIDVLKSRMASGTSTKQIVSTLQNMFQMGGSTQAMPILEEVLKRRPVPVEALLLSARIHAEQGNNDRAIELAREALDSVGSRGTGVGGRPFTGMDAQILQTLNQLYTRSGRKEEFMAEMRAKVDARPRSLLHRKRLAEAYMWNGDRDKSIEQYEAMHKQRPGDIHTITVLAQHYMQHNKHSKAFDLYKKLLTSQPGMYQQIYSQLFQLKLSDKQKIELAALEDRLIQRATNANEVLQFGHHALQRKDVDRAITLFKRAIAIEPGNVQAHGALASAYTTAKDLESAKKTYGAMLEATRRNHGGNLQQHFLEPMASIYAKLDALPELATLAESFGELKNGGPAKAQILAAIAREEERYEDAIQLLRDGAQSENDQRFVRAMVQLAQEGGKPKLAIEILERAAELNPRSNYWNEIAQLHIAQGNKEQAAEAWSKQAAMGNSMRDYSNVFRSMVRHKMFDEAEAFYVEHRRILRRPQLARSVEQAIARSHMREGAFEDIIKSDLLTTENPRLESFIQLLAGQVQYWDAHADALVEAAMELAPDNPALLHRRAQLLTHAGHHGEAVSVWARVVELQPNNMNYRYQYAGALSKDNRRDEATAMLTEWAEAQPTVERVKALMGYLNPTDNPAKYRAFRDGIVSKFKGDDRKAVRALFAPLDAQTGDLDSTAVSLREQYENRKDGKTFRKYFAHEFEHGSLAKAAALLTEYMNSSAFSSQYVPHREAFTTCFRTGGYTMANDLTIKMLTWGRRHVVFREAAPVYEQYGAYWRFDELVRSHIESNKIERKGLPVSYVLDMFQWHDATTVIALAKRWFNVEEGETDLAFAYQLLQLTDDPGSIRALLEDQHLRPVDWPSHAYVLATAYHKIGDIEKRDEALEVLLSQDEHPGGALNLGNALGILQASGDYERMVSLIENRTEGIAGDNQHLLQRLGRAYIGVGRYDDALAIWEKDPDEYGSQFAEALMNAEAYAHAIPMFEYESKKSPHESWHYGKLAKAVHLSGNTEAYREFFRNARAQMRTDPQRNGLAAVYAQFLHDQNLIAAAVENDDAVEDEALAQALVTCLSDGMFDDYPEAIPRLLQLMPRLDGGPFASKVAVGYILLRLDSPEEASRWFTMAGVERDALHEKLNAAQGLKKCGYESDALDLIESLIDDHADALMNSRQFFNIVATADDKQRGASIAKRFRKHIQNDLARKRWEFMWLEASGDRPDDALDLCESLAASTELPLDLSLRIESRLNDAGRFEPALEMAEHIAQGSSTRDQRDLAARRAMSLAWHTGDFAKAVRFFSEAVLAQPAMMRDVRRELFQLVDEDAVDALSAAATEFITTSPAHPAVTEIIHLLDELSESGLALDIEPLLTIEGIPPETISAFHTRAGVLEDWRLETHVYESSEMPFESAFAIDTYAERIDVALITNSKMLPGAVMIDRLGDAGPQLGANSWLVARTEIESASSKTRTLSFGSCHQAVSVWVNGKRVFRQNRHREFNFDQNRFEVVLEQGTNEIVIQLYGPGGREAFALGFLGNE